MSTDRELLELAAKAAGVKGAYEPVGIRTPAWPWLWNPLANDGDALLLAVTLNMTLRCYMGNTCAQIGVPGLPNAYCDETNHSDPAAATRRAIVRAAAEIGKATP